MSQFKLTDVERVILANQYEILSKLNNDEYYEKIFKELRNGHEWLYSQHIKGTLLPILSKDDTEHVLCILQIYKDLRDSYDKLEDKSNIEEHSIEFPGFDGNHEPELLSFAHALIEDNRYIDVLGKVAINSHSSRTQPTYKRMVSTWRELGKPSYPYSKETILSIINGKKL